MKLLISCEMTAEGPARTGSLEGDGTLLDLATIYVAAEHICLGAAATSPAGHTMRDWLEAVALARQAIQFSPNEGQE